MSTTLIDHQISLVDFDGRVCTGGGSFGKTHEECPDSRPARRKHRRSMEAEHEAMWQAARDEKPANEVGISISCPRKFCSSLDSLEMWEGS